MKNFLFAVTPAAKDQITDFGYVEKVGEDFGVFETPLGDLWWKKLERRDIQGTEYIIFDICVPGTEEQGRNIFRRLGRYRQNNPANALGPFSWPKVKATKPAWYDKWAYDWDVDDQGDPIKVGTVERVFHVILGDPSPQFLVARDYDPSEDDITNDVDVDPYPPTVEE